MLFLPRWFAVKINVRGKMYCPKKSLWQKVCCMKLFPPKRHLAVCDCVYFKELCVTSCGCYILFLTLHNKRVQWVQASHCFRTDHISGAIVQLQVNIYSTFIFFEPIKDCFCATSRSNYCWIKQENYPWKPKSVIFDCIRLKFVCFSKWAQK